MCSCPPLFADYSRSETAFAVISLGLMALGMIFSVYAVREPRYMFKRLAGALHIMTGMLASPGKLFYSKDQSYVIVSDFDAVP